ncbi:cation-dependent mannose-6-phosphate receptor [Zootoca vivipara]|uniref:cation-dependent mannose-6-phosphate receptor n=1 Tax=Zootoca vivipara TaxID=8524 RepID=UPI00293BD6DB|nr:cation-dependent mannose-6-phosphate receptor [Zootoca vivipara]
MFLTHSCFHAVLLALITTVMAKDNECDLLGEEGSESTKEKKVLERLEPIFGKSFEIEGENEEHEKYTYKFRVCRDASNKTNSGVVQINDKHETKVLGRINETHLASGSSWILLTYKGGDPYSSRCGKEQRKAIVMITCNKKTLASGFTMVSEEREKKNECFYLFELESSLACPPEDSHLSIGSILLLTLAPLVTVYLIGGFLYQRLLVGAKGMEQFPHLAFWQDLGNLVADGCDFVFRSKPRNVPAAYRGVGDDQLGEESEERDDHLLPM